MQVNPGENVQMNRYCLNKNTAEIQREYHFTVFCTIKIMHSVWIKEDVEINDQQCPRREKNGP